MKEFFRKPYWNVVVLSLALALAFTNVVVTSFIDLPERLGFSPLAIYLSHGILFTLSALVFGNLLGTAIVFAKRTAKGTGGALLSLNAAALAFAAFLVVKSGLSSGLIFYLGPAPPELAHIAEVGNAIESAMTLNAVLAGMFSLVGSLIATFCQSRRSDGRRGRL